MASNGYVHDVKVVIDMIKYGIKLRFYDFETVIKMISNVYRYAIKSDDMIFNSVGKHM